MTELDDKASASREIPKITSEEDKPFPRGPGAGNTADLGLGSARPGTGKPVDQKLDEADSLEKEITRFRYQTGRKVLYLAMGAMSLFVLLDLVSAKYMGIQSDLVTSAFEAFKLITMTVLGYIFGSSGTKN